jgi:DNA-binding transcriptional LysR family regulator
MPNREFLSAESLRRKIVTRCKLSHLRVVLEVARQESISRAASALHLAQPAVTKKLREVETILGTALFERRPRAVVPNAFGEIVLPHIESLFAELNRIGDDLTAARNGLTGTLAVGGTMTVLPYLLPHSLMMLARSGQGMVIRVVEGTIDQMVRALAQNEVDLVLGRVLGTSERYNFTQEILFEDPFVPIVGAKHPLAGSRLQMKDLSNYGWILPPEGSSAREPLERYMLRNDIRMHQRTIETVSFQVTMSLLEDSDMIAVLPLHLARLGETRKALKIVGPEIGAGSLPVGLTYRSDRPLPPLALSLTEAFRATVAALTPTPEFIKAL